MPDPQPQIRILLVEPDDVFRAILRAAVHPMADVESVATFEAARAQIDRASDVPIDLLVTNIRLGPYNGLHLVYLIDDLPAVRRPRAIAYTDEGDMGLARETQLAGAFYETRACVAVTLMAFLEARLPSRDRRDPDLRDRRTRFRGGRRCWESHQA